MAWNFKETMTSNKTIVSDEEIWNAIRYLDPDR